MNTYKRKKKQSNIILIGCGPHSKRVYLPALRALQSEKKVELKLVIDLMGRKQQVEDLIKNNEFDCEIFLCEYFDKNLPKKMSLYLDDFCRTNEVTGVIIATEPLVHIAYAEWALRNGLNILMDKPVSTQVDCVSELNSAKSILKDFLYLRDIYLKSNNYYKNIFIVNTQRRFHPGFDFVLEKIKEVSDLTNCPVTNINASHCDGQWRLPSEIVTQDYHPYNSGYGKASHSGYHIFDIVYRMYMASVTSNKVADKFELVSAFIQPNGFIEQLTQDDYKKIFGSVEYEDVKHWNDDELIEIFKGYGEIDLSSIITLKKKDIAVANINISLLHNGFGQRTWLTPGDDLYKGNGRVKHEHYSIQQGPFQNIQIHSYQSKDKHDNMKSIEDSLGGNNHFDVVIFRNPLVNPKGESMQKFTMKDIVDKYNFSHEKKLITENVKFQIVNSFVSFLNGEIERTQMKSQIVDHYIPVAIMSSVYQSHVLRKNDKNCVVSMPFDN